MKAGQSKQISRVLRCLQVANSPSSGPGVGVVEELSPQQQVRSSGALAWLCLVSSAARIVIQLPAVEQPQRQAQPNVVAGDRGQDEAASYALDVAVDNLGRVADGLAPAEELPDPLRCFWDRAYPPMRVLRPSMADCCDV